MDLNTESYNYIVGNINTVEEIFRRYEGDLSRDELLAVCVATLTGSHISGSVNTW